MVYHDASREGVISCWPRDAELPLRQPITPARSCGTMMMPKRAQITMTTRTPRHRHHAAARIRASGPSIRSANVVSMIAWRRWVRSASTTGSVESVKNG